MIETSSRNVTRSRRVSSVLRAAVVVCALALALASIAQAAAPPTFPHVATALPTDDIVILDGYAAGTKATVDVIRDGFRIGTSGSVTIPAGGALEINHPAVVPDCWRGWTPDIAFGDVIRVTQGAAVEETRVQNLTTGSPEDTNATTVTVHGTAQDVNGIRLPIAELELRLGNQAFGNLLGGGPFILAPGTKAQGGTSVVGTLVYDGLSSNWTATFVFAGPGAGAAHAAALAAGAEISWLSAGLTESTAVTDAPEPLPACPLVPSGAYAATLTAPNVVSNTTPLTVQGAAPLTATSGTVTLTDGATSETETITLTAPNAGVGGRTWTATFAANKVANLANGTLTATPTFNPGAVIGIARTVIKNATGAPVATISSPVPPATSTSSNVTLTFSSPANDVTFNCQKTDAPAGPLVPCTSPHTFASVPNGLHTYAVQAVDNGNAGPFANVDVTVARPLPVAQILSGPAALSNQGQPVFTFTASPPAATFRCSVDGGAFAACSSPFQTPVLGQGVHAFSVAATDDAGNAGGPTAAAPWTVDTIAPNTTLVSGPAPNIKSTTAEFAMSSTETPQLFDCKLDAAAFAPCTSPVTFANLFDGPHTVQIRARDQAGNVDTTPIDVAFTVKGPPNTTVISAPPASTTATTATFGFTSNDVSATFECSLDAAPFAFCAAPVTMSGLTVGSHSFRVRAVDSEGTPDPTPASHTWTITLPDTERPTVSASTVATAKLTMGRNGVLVVTGGCDERCTIVARATVSVPNLRGGKPTLYALKSKTIDVAAGATGAARLTLSARQLRTVRNALKAAKRVRVTITVIGTDAAGNTSNALRTVILTKKHL